MKQRSAYIIMLFLTLAIAQADLYEPDNDASTATWLTSEQTHNFSSAADTDYFRFNATKGTVYLLETFNQTPQATTDTIAAVLFPNDVLLVANDDDMRFSTTNSRITFQAPSTGTYYARITEYNDLAGGVYTIRLTQLGVINTTILTPTSNRNATQGEVFPVQALVSCTGGPCGTVRLTLDPKEEDTNIDPLVRKELADTGEADVLITFKKTKQKNTIAAQHLLAQTNDPRNVHAYERIPVVAATLDEADITRLSEDASISYISLNREVHITLDSSAPSIGAPQVWQEQFNETNITGSGVTVCVIDTGVTYTHADFGSCNATPNINDGSCPTIIGGVNYCADEACTSTNYNPLDNNGHGSHVAGTIISQNDTYRGIAPGAKVVAMKALNSAGTGTMDDIIAAMDWCIANATQYNISVISMSLGADVLHDNCDRDAGASAIQAARDAGIIVTVAAGNNFAGEPYLGISSPGCVSNATSVGATDDTDTYATFSKRDITLDLLAPGVNIVSTDYAGAHIAMSGTSMATPHVAGAVALLIQHTRLAYGRTPTPTMLEHLLKSAGTQATDTAFSNLTKPRINVYQATQLKGDVPTTVGALPFWTPSTNPTACTLASGENCTVSWTVNTTTSSGNYEFFVIAENNYSYTESNRFNVTLIPATRVSATLTPSNTTLYVNESLRVQLLVESEDAINRTNVTVAVTLAAWNVTNTTLEANSTANDTLTWTIDLAAGAAWDVNITLVPFASGNATMNSTVTWNDTVLTAAQSVVQVLIPDTVAPVRTGFTASTVTTTSATLTLSTDESASCAYSTLDENRSNMTSFSATNATTHTTTVGSLRAATTYTYFARCADASGNENTDSVNVSFTTNAQSSGGGGRRSGGGGGGKAQDTSLAAERSWQLETTSGEQTLRIARKDIALESITFSTDEKLQALIRVALKQQVPLAKEHTYQYIEVEHPDDLLAQDVTIEFSVPRAWIAGQGLLPDAVQLYRFEDDSWHALDTNVTGSNSSAVFYRALSPGLSLFAVSAREPTVVAAAVPEPVSGEQRVGETRAAPEPALVPVRSPGREVAWLVAIAVAIGAGVLFTAYESYVRRKD